MSIGRPNILVKHLPKHSFDIQLTWKTANELNTSNFIVERSTDGKHFIAIVSVNAKGIGANSYDFTDNNPTNGTNYYRLQSVDKDGAVSFSKVVSVQFTVKSNQLTVFPNPTKEVLNANIVATTAEKVIVQILDLEGKVLQQKMVQLQLGTTKFSLNTSSLAKGSYLLLIKGNEVQKQLFIKQ